MRTVPDNDPKKPLKYNILWLISKGYVLDITLFYDILSRKRRDMPNNKDKYRSIERSLLQLEKEGWSIKKELDQNGVAWYSADIGFGDFVGKELLKEINNVVNETKMREIRRLNEALKIKYKIIDKK